MPKPDDDNTLELQTVSFCRGRINDKPCLVIYDSADDRTQVLTWQSRGYDAAIAAISLLEMLAKPDPTLVSRRVGHEVEGTDASH